MKFQAHRRYVIRYHVNNAIGKGHSGQENLRRPIVGDVEEQQGELQTLAGGKETLSDNPGVLRGGTHAQGTISAVRSRARILWDRPSYQGKGREEDDQALAHDGILCGMKNNHLQYGVWVLFNKFFLFMFSNFYSLHNKICVILANLQ